MTEIKSATNLENLFATLLGKPVREVVGLFEFFEEEGYVLAVQPRKTYLEQKDWMSLFRAVKDLGGNAKRDEKTGEWSFKVPKAAGPEHKSEAPNIREPPNQQSGLKAPAAGQPVSKAPAEPKNTCIGHELPIQTGPAGAEKPADVSNEPKVSNIPNVPITTGSPPSLSQPATSATPSPREWKPEYPPTITLPQPSIFQIWGLIKGLVVPKDQIPIFTKDCVDDYSIIPLLCRIKNDDFIVTGFMDLLDRETWYPENVKNDLVCFDANTKAFPYSTESLIPKTEEDRRNRFLERIIIQDLVAQLSAEGWNIEENVNLQYGRADVIARRQGETLLIEAKSSTNTNEISHALGQLLFYQTQVSYSGKIRMAIAVSQDLNDFCKNILQKYGIEILIMTNRKATSIEERRSEKWKRQK